MKDKRALILLALAAFAYLFIAAPINDEMISDFRSFYYAGMAFLGEGNIYDYRYLNKLALELNGRGYVWPYLYLPPLAFYMAPLSFLAERDAATVWVLMSVVLGVFLLITSVHLSSKLYDKVSSQKKQALQLLSLCLIFILPFDNNLKVGQVNILVITLIVVAMVQSLVNKRDFLAGFLLAAAIMVKLTPIGLLLYFALNHRYKIFYGCVVGLLVLAAPTFVVSGGLDNWKYFQEFTSLMGYGKTIPGLFPAAGIPNFSVAGWVARFIPNQATVSVVTIIILSLLGVVLLYQHYRLRRKGRGELLLLPYLVLMVLGSPLAYLHHVIYIFPGVLLTCWILIQRKGRYVFLLISLLSLTLVASIDWPMRYGRLGLELNIFTSLNLYALLGLFFLGLTIPDIDGETTALSGVKHTPK